LARCDHPRSALRRLQAQQYSERTALGDPGQSDRGPQPGSSKACGVSSRAASPSQTDPKYLRLARTAVASAWRSFDRANYFDVKGKENNQRLGVVYTDEHPLTFITNIYGVLLTHGILLRLRLRPSTSRISMAHHGEVTDLNGRQVTTLRTRRPVASLIGIDKRWRSMPLSAAEGPHSGRVILGRQ
jgi:hypothetical protein